MNIVQGANPHLLLKEIAIHPVQGILIINKLGDDIYIYPDQINWELKQNLQDTTQDELQITPPFGFTSCSSTETAKIALDSPDNNGDGTERWSKILADSYCELDGFYCINRITHTVSYLGTEWDDVILGLKFRHLLASR